MTKKYPSKVSYGLLAFVFAVFYGPLVPDLIGNGYSSAALGILAFLTPVFGLVVYVLFTTAYTIGEGQLRVSCGPITYPPIDIALITEINKTNTFMASPAASFDRLEIRYGKFDQIVVSPRDKAGFIQHLASINPGIKTQLSGKDF